MGFFVMVKINNKIGYISEGTTSKSQRYLFRYVKHAMLLLLGSRSSVSTSPKTSSLRCLSKFCLFIRQSDSHDIIMIMQRPFTPGKFYEEGPFMYTCKDLKIYFTYFFI